MNTKALITVKQLPIITEQLKLIKEDIQGRVDTALAMVCTEDSVKDIKAVRSSLNKEFAEIETKRKEVKKAVMSPYEQFEAVYKENITDIFKPADAELKKKIDTVERVIKNEKTLAVEEYFAEYQKSKDIDFLELEDANINITLSASIKSLKEQAQDFIDKVNDDLILIETQEHKSEILVEYKNTLNASQAITSVVNRHKAIEAEKERREAREKAEQERFEKANQTVIEPAPIKPSVFDPEEIEQMIEDFKSPILQYTETYNLTATAQQFGELKAFMDAHDIGYDLF